MEAKTVESGEAALEALRGAHSQGKPFKLVLADVAMPGMDGFDLAKMIRQTTRAGELTIVILTSAGQRGDAARCRELGVRAYLTKPIREWELRETLRRALGVSPETLSPDQLITRHSLREGRASESLSGPNRPASEAAPPPKRRRVLLAEDNPVNRLLAVRLLEKRGYQVTVAETGREALAAWEKQPFDAILMDVQMPEMDGLEATAAIRAREHTLGSHVPVIAMTAHALKGDRERCLTAGMDGYISKPLNATSLYDLVESLAPADGVPSK